MAINTGNIAALLQPGLRQAFGSNQGVWRAAWNEPPVPPPTPEWKALYERERERVFQTLYEQGRLERWEAWLATHTPTVQERIRKLNPMYPKPGLRPRGWNPKMGGDDLWVHDVVSAYKYKSKWGVNPMKIVRLNSGRRGRRKYVTRVDYLDGTAHDTRDVWVNAYPIKLGVTGL